MYFDWVLRMDCLDFWIKETVVYEQPNVEYQYQTLLQFRGIRYAACDCILGIVLRVSAMGNHWICTTVLIQASTICMGMNWGYLSSRVLNWMTIETERQTDWRCRFKYPWLPQKWSVVSQHSHTTMCSWRTKWSTSLMLCRSSTTIVPPSYLSWM